MPKIIQGKDRQSRIERLEDSITVGSKGKGSKLGPPDWVKKNQ